MLVGIYRFFHNLVWCDGFCVWFFGALECYPCVRLPEKIGNSLNLRAVVSEGDPFFALVVFCWSFIVHV
jgi:hypothetical protein